MSIGQIAQGVTHLVSTKPVTNLVPEEGVEQILTIIGSADERTIAAGQKTAKQFVKFREEMDSRFTTLSQENLTLSVALTEAQSREIELTKVNDAKIEALEEEVASLQQALAMMREEMVEKDRNANERIAAAIQAQTIAVETAVEAGKSQSAAAYQTGRAEVQQEMQRRLAQISSYLRGLINGIEIQCARFKSCEGAKWNTDYSGLKQSDARCAADMLLSITENIADPKKPVRTHGYTGCSVM